MTEPTHTFGAEDIMAALGVTGADFEVHESGDDAQSDTGVTTDREGKYVAASDVQHNKRNEKTVTLHAKNPSGAAATFTLGGQGTAGVVVTRAAARQTHNAEATLQVTAHIHDGAGANSHLEGPVSESVTTPSLGFGVLAVQLGGDLEDCQSSEITWEIDHVDRQNNVGNHLIGASTGLRVTCTEEYVDGGAAITVPSPWKQDTQRKATINNNFYTRNVNAHKYVV